MIPFNLPAINVMPADSARKAGRSKETTADESMVQDLLIMSAAGFVLSCLYVIYRLMF